MEIYDSIKKFNLIFYNGDIEQIKLLLTTKHPEYGEIGYLDNNYYALSVICRFNRIDILNYLLKKKIDIRQIHIELLNVLFREGHIEILQIILRKVLELLLVRSKSEMLEIQEINNLLGNSYSFENSIRNRKLCIVPTNMRNKLYNENEVFMLLVKYGFFELLYEFWPQFYNATWGEYNKEESYNTDERNKYYEILMTKTPFNKQLQFIKFYEKYVCCENNSAELIYETIKFKNINLFMLLTNDLLSLKNITGSNYFEKLIRTAIKSNAFEIFKELYNIIDNTKKNLTEYCLYWSMKSNSSEILNFMLNQNIKITNENEFVRFAIQSNNFEVFKYFKNQGFDIADPQFSYVVLSFYFGRIRNYKIARLLAKKLILTPAILGDMTLPDNFDEPKKWINYCLNNIFTTENLRYELNNILYHKNQKLVKKIIRKKPGYYLHLHSNYETNLVQLFARTRTINSEDWRLNSSYLRNLYHHKEFTKYDDEFILTSPLDHTDKFWIDEKVRRMINKLMPTLKFFKRKTNVLKYAIK